MWSIADFWQLRRQIIIIKKPKINQLLRKPWLVTSFPREVLLVRAVMHSTAIGSSPGLWTAAADLNSAAESLPLCFQRLLRCTEQAAWGSPPFEGWVALSNLYDSQTKMHNVTEIKTSPSAGDACLARGQEQSSTPAIALRRWSDREPHSKGLLPPLRKPCLLSGNLTQCGDRGSAIARLDAYLRLYDSGLPSPSVRTVLPFPGEGGLSTRWAAWQRAVPGLLLLRGQENEMLWLLPDVLHPWNFSELRVHYLEVSQLPCLRQEESSSCCAYYECWIWTTRYVLEYLLLPLHQVACENTAAHKELWISSSSFRVKPKGRIPTAFMLSYKIRQLRQHWTHLYKAEKSMLFSVL